MKKAFEFINVKISLGDKVLFPCINLTLFEGDRVMLRGKNGSGKSLLLELVFGGYTNELRKRYSGLKVEGQILDAQGHNLLDPKTIRCISYVSQNEDFHSNGTFISEAITASRGVGLELNEPLFDDLLHRFDIFSKKKQPIRNNVSCGEGKILHIITRLLKLDATNVLFLDEPLNHLSFQNSRMFNLIMNEIKERNPKLTVIMISHCRAVDFVDSVIQYNYETASMEKHPYHSYNCFSAE